MTIPIRRDDAATLVDIADLLSQLLAEQRRTNVLLERGRSYVEIDSNGKAGETKVKIREVEGSAPPVDDAIESYTAAMRAAVEGHMAGWAATVDALREARS